MKDWERILVGPSSTIRETMAVIDAGAAKIAIVIDEERRLLGTLSDGDLRRALLDGRLMQSPIRDIVHEQATSAPETSTREEIISLMRRTGLQQIPLVDPEGRVVGLEVLQDFFLPEKHDNAVVIMAGGRGSRLKELTASVPKPMLHVGGRPMLETILQSYVEQGFSRFYFAVNYKAELIEAHFGDGSAFGADITYLRERQPMGTAGALAMIPERPGTPILVANGDVLAKFDHADMLRIHCAQDAAATMAVREYEYQVPFGVIREEDGVIHSIVEKPVQRFMVCAGMYVLSPEVLDVIPADTPMDMPAVFDQLIDEGRKTCCLPVRSYWLDVGRVGDYERAQLDFDEIFR